ncbi:hypothetical protein KY290_033774 [Solanum tuberosum]|uniref:Transmembrane protein n=1 Tax=Solanum tuberosum TaxID=4113 RepID=A0ABQ7U304_SOLTU|nr:hypothetical protein KY290_033774 [Solanum tuberosum]
MQPNSSKISEHAVTASLLLAVVRWRKGLAGDGFTHVVRRSYWFGLYELGARCPPEFAVASFFAGMVGFCWWCDGARAGCFPVGFGLWLGLVVASKGENKDGVLVVNRLLFDGCLVVEGTDVLVLFVSWSDKKRRRKRGGFLVVNSPESGETPVTCRKDKEQ